MRNPIIPNGVSQNGMVVGTVSAMDEPTIIAAITKAIASGLYPFDRVSIGSRPYARIVFEAYHLSSLRE